MSPASTLGARRPDRSSPMPLWAQVGADLRRRCSAGDFAAGVPSEHELCTEYGVSRHTVREALRALRTEGVISSHRGRSSVVQPAAFSQRLGAVSSLFRDVESQGAVQTSEVLRLEATSSAEAAVRLGLPADALLLVLERVRLADGVPLAHDISWLPHTLAHPLLDADFGHTALYDELARIGVVVDGGTERFGATTADACLADLLGVEPGAAVLHVERLATSAGRPIEWRETDVRGDRFVVEADWAGRHVTVALAGTSLTPITEGSTA